MVKGEDEYMIVVSGVKDTGLCGGYWGNTENLGSRRRSKPVEALQIGNEKKRRGSVGSVGSGQYCRHCTSQENCSSYSSMKEQQETVNMAVSS